MRRFVNGSTITNYGLLRPSDNRQLTTGINYELREINYELKITDYYIIQKTGNRQQESITNDDPITIGLKITLIEQYPPE